MKRTELVREAGTRFDMGDDDGFVALFDPALRVYSEPELGEAPIVSSRNELSSLIAAVRERARKARIANIEELGPGVVADLILLSPESGSGNAWRMALAIRCSGDTIAEVRAFWQRNAAEAALRVSQ